MKIMAEIIDACYRCKWCLSQSGHKGMGHRCCYGGKQKTIKDYNMIPKWCPLEDAHEKKTTRKT